MGAFGFRRGGAFALGALVAGIAHAAFAVDVVGETEAILQWDPAPGPVTGYYVIVSRDGGLPQAEAISFDEFETLTGEFGETLVVQVAAFDADGVSGPVSEASEPVTFVAGDPGGGDPPPPGGDPPPPGDDPPPPGDDPGSGGSGAVRDFNGDGTSDLVVRAGDSIWMWAMAGASAAVEIPLPDAPSGARLVGTGDYDGNGSSDLLWENPSSGTVTLWRMEGGVLLDTAVLDSSSLPSAEAWHVGGSVDLDGDGADDVLWFSRVSGEVEIWSIAGSSVASRSRLDGHTGAWSVVATADSDGSGVGEIVWLDEIDRLLERRDPAGSPESLGNLDASWRVIGSADLDANGASELVTWQASTGDTQAWTLDAQGFVGARDLPNAAAAGTYAGSGDYDGDGREDVAWSDAASGTVTLWLSTAGSSLVVGVERALPPGGDVVSGANGSDDSAFRDRFCSTDYPGHIWKRFNRCLAGRKRWSSCQDLDLDSDGAVTTTDQQILELRTVGQTCQDR